MKKLYENLVKKLESYNNFLITTHTSPDADGLGSQVALAKALTILGKKAKCVNEEPLDYRYKYLDNNNFIISLDDFLSIEGNFQPDLVIVVDTNKVSRTGIRMGQFLNSFSEIIFIDHHPIPENITSIGTRFVDTKAAATGEMIANVIEKLGITFDKDMALAIYTAILIDTNTFRYPSVTARTHNFIAKMLETGIDTTLAYNHIYGTKKLEQMHLLGEILRSCQVNEDGNVAWIHISEERFKLYNSCLEDTHAYINNLLILENVKVVCMFRDDQRKLKLSLRSHGDIDVGEIAMELGGGGHNHSAATVFEIAPTINRDDLIQTTITKIEMMVNGN
jgi:phosphoesterase RecJ-like protein